MVLNKNQKSIKQYEDWLRKNPQSEAFAHLVECYRKVGWLKQALDLGLQGVRVHPHFAQGYVALGRVQFDLEDHKQALVSFTQAVDLEPNNLLARQMRATTFLITGQKMHAQKDIDYILNQNPYHAKALALLEKMAPGMSAQEIAESIKRGGGRRPLTMGSDLSGTSFIEKPPSASRVFDLPRPTAVAHLFHNTRGAAPNKNITRQQQDVIRQVNQLETMLEKIQTTSANSGSSD